MNKVYIVAARRTALGSHLGSLKATGASEMGAAVIKAILNQTNIDPNAID